ncbi:MAG TPA: Ku protein [Solirubrobacteraceae bacterium]|nr:Ku protein [Solirubrobacteraceae bacterium]
MAPRSIWNGTIAFGLVAVPVKVFSATESHTIHFREVHAKDGSRIEHRRINPKTGKAVDYEDIVKGYELSKGKWVELTDDEIAAAAGGQSRRIDVDHFVPASDIAPEFFERTYYLGAQDKGRDAYALLHAALSRSGRAGVGFWVFHNRERTVVLRPVGDVLLLHTMRFVADLVEPSELKLGRVQRKPSAREIKMASALVDGLHTKFDPSAYKDTYRDAVMEVIKAKAAGKNIEPPADEEPEAADDLLAALEASLANA